MNCPSCGAPMRIATGDASMRCDYCRNVVILRADDVGMRFLDEIQQGSTCPVCSIPLDNAVLGNIKLCGCKHCMGMFISMSAFQPLIDQLRDKYTCEQIPSTADPADLRREVPCPKCHHKMDVHFYMGGGSAIIATCENCEMNWLDGGMLMRIVKTPHEDSTSFQRECAYGSSYVDSTPDSGRESVAETIGNVIFGSMNKSNRDF
jgi:Zn-finger nucleic acid-binding protein